MNLKELLKLAGKNGKVVIINEDGEVKGVFLSQSESARLFASSNQKDSHVSILDPEKVNREILEAQLTENVDLGNKNLETIESTPRDYVNPNITPPSPIKNILAKRARDLFVSQPYGRQEPPEYDMRAEVVDPNFGADEVDTSNIPTVMTKTNPLVSVDSEMDEEIKPNFEDI